MQITTQTNLFLSTARPAPVASTQAEQTVEGHGDSVSLGSHISARNVTKMALMTASGFVPVVGAATNFIGMLGAGLNGKQGLSNLSFAAAGANLVGTGSLVGGLITGNSLATNIGLGMLGVSGVAAGVTSFAFL